MTCHKQLWRIGEERRANAEIVVARITADMFDEHIDILNLESIQFTIHQPQIAAITIAAYSTEGPKSRQFLRYLDATNVTSVPYFITRLEIMEIFLVPIAVRIA